MPVKGPGPLVLMAAAWLIGLLCAEAAPAGSWQAPLAVAALFTGVLVAVWGMQAPVQQPGALGARWPVYGLAVVAFAAGASLGPRPPIAPIELPAGMARLDAVVEHSQPGPAGSGRAVLRVLRGVNLESGAQLPAGVLLSAGPARLPSRARVRVLAKVAPRMPFRNPTPHPPAPRRFALQGSARVADAAAVRVLDAPLFAGLLDAARVRVRDALDATLPPDAAGVARALVLGEGQAVSESDQQDVRDAGLLHVFAVSGLHVTTLAGIAVALLRRALLRCAPLATRLDVQRVACAAGAPLALLYAELAGGAPSARRAAATAALGWMLAALGRRPDATAVCATAILVLGALDPREALRPAFLLSIAATAAILDARGEPVRTLRDWLRAAWVLSARTWLATAPVALWCFGTLPLAGLLANVALLPVGNVLLQLAAAHAVTATLTPFGAVTAAPLAMLADGFLAACAAFARLGPKLAWPAPDVPQGLILTAAVAILLLARRLRVRIAVATGAALLLVLLELRLRAVEQPADKLRVLFADVGQGDAALVDLPDGRLMLIDAGGNPGGGADPGRAVLVPLLEARRRARVDLAVLTHPHPDHYGGLRAVLDRLPISELWDTGQGEAERELSGTSAETAQLLDLARARGTRVRKPAELCDRVHRAGPARIHVLWPCPSYDSTHDPNDNSLVLRIEFGQHALVFAGDAEQHAEAQLVARGALRHADVLKVGHHGSRTSTGPALLAAVSPAIAIISAGAGNRFGHPHPEVTERLRARGTRVFNLADTGGALFESDGTRYTLRTLAGTAVQHPEYRRVSAER
jgi:competence protein ComEC